MFAALGVFIGGGTGSVLRWLVCNRISTHWGTMAVNILGAFFIGCVYAYFQKNLETLPPELKAFIMTGLLGGFTTFSTYLLNFSNLLEKNNYLEAGVYLSLSIIIGLIFLLSGIKCAKLIG